MIHHNLGVTTIDVTPPVGIQLAGYAARNSPSAGVYQPLRAVCIALDDGGDPSLLISIEWLGFYDRTVEAREKISARTGVRMDRIMLSGTHTHCGPVLRRDMDTRRHGDLDEGYIDNTLDALADSAVKALAARQPAHLRVGTGWCGISSSRRRPDGQGGVQFKPSLDAPHDHQVEVMVVESVDGALRHVLYNYACHPTSAGAILEIGGDYVTFASDRIEAHHPSSIACFFQGCAGDQKVDARDDDDDGYRKLDLEEVQQRGELLGDAVLRVIESDDLKPVEGKLDWTQEMVEIETDLPSRDELQQHLTSSQAYVVEWAQHHLDLLAAGMSAQRKFDFEVQTLRIGQDLAVVGLAGEMSVEYGLHYRRQFGADYTALWTLGYTNEMVGYVPVQRQISEGGYEVVDNNRRLLYTGPFAATTEGLINKAVARALGA
jgi:neutral ceramidase